MSNQRETGTALFYGHNLLEKAMLFLCALNQGLENFREKVSKMNRSPKPTLSGPVELIGKGSACQHSAMRKPTKDLPVGAKHLSAIGK